MRKVEKVVPIVLFAVVAIIIFKHLFFTGTTATNQGSTSGQVKEIPDLIVTVNEKKVNFQDAIPIITNERILVPLRVIFESMGAVVDWKGESQGIFATRKGKSVQLSINSNNALINNNKTFLGTPVTLYKDRTMIPLRFIGEAFDGIVDWNSQTSVIAISIPKEEMLEIPDMKVTLNNNQLKFGIPPVFKDGRNYIPVEAIFDGLENEVYWTKKVNNISASIDGASMELFVGRNYAIVNGKRINTTDFPIEYKGAVLAPVRFVTEAFGGIAHFVEKNKITHIYINRPKFKTSFLSKDPVIITKPKPVSGVTLMGNRMLMVSDNPEILNNKTIPFDRATLCSSDVNSINDNIDHRVFGWHINNLGKEIKLGITLENLSSTNDIEVVGLKGINRMSPNGWSNYDVGLPIAETVLSNQLLNIKMNNSVVKAGQTIVLQSFQVESDFLIGFLDEFTIKKTKGTGKLNYRIRTVLCQSGNELSSIKSNTIDVDRENTHPRGSWGGSLLYTKLPLYRVGSGEVAYSLSNGFTDNIMSKETALNGTCTVIGNSGHYGANYKIEIPVVNNTGIVKTVRVRIGARGGLYAGAVRTKDGVFIIPLLEPAKEVANVIDYKVKEKSDIIELEIMHAGGSALAMAVDLITLE
ncbi:MAG: copper amine oxidase N-terminal domain-containing protein [Bacillota bacterium]|jgi:hypothetical protein